MNAIETIQLTKFYGRHRGVENLDLEVKEGEIFGFVGPNGAGKSTTIRTIVGLILPTSGSARVFDRDVVREGKEIRRQIGYLPSEVEYYDGMRVRELLEYSQRFYNQQGDGRLLELAEMLDLDLTREISDLSHGNKKKVALVQALLHHPRLIILDEPTDGLDPLIQTRLYHLLRQENEKGATIFFSSHVLSEVERLCRRVAIIRAGTLAAVEEIGALKRKRVSRVCAEFSSPFPPDQLSLPGVVSLQTDDRKAQFLYSGEMAPLLQRLAEMAVDRLTVEEPSLEEVFMHYYEGER